jgi:hypothetical protein
MTFSAPFVSTAAVWMSSRLAASAVKVMRLRSVPSISSTVAGPLAYSSEPELPPQATRNSGRTIAIATIHGIR